MFLGTSLITLTYFSSLELFNLVDNVPIFSLTGYVRGACGARKRNGLAAHLTVTCASCLLSHPLASLAEIDATEVRVAKAARVTQCITGVHGAQRNVRRSACD